MAEAKIGTKVYLYSYLLTQSDCIIITSLNLDKPYICILY